MVGLTGCRVCGHGATRFTVLLSLLSTVNVSSELRRRCLSRRTRNRRRPRPSIAPRDPPSPPLPFCPTNFAPGPSSFTPSNHFLLYAPTFLLCALETDKYHHHRRRRRRQDRPVKKRGGTRTVRLERHYRVALVRAVGNDAKSFAFHVAASPDVANSFFPIMTD